MILVTTAINNFDEFDDDIVLLGGWCKKYAEDIEQIQSIKSIIGYHWDDRSKLFEDYNYIIELYEKLLPEYSESLNKLHNVDYSISFWKIIIGPWLLYFIAVLFDRWHTIMYAAKNFKFDYVALSEVKHDLIVPNDMSDFYELCVGDDWNNYIFGEIVKHWTLLDYKEFQLAASSISDTLPSFRFRIKKILYKLFNKLSMFSLNNELILVDSYMPIIDQWKLEISLGQKPSYFFFYSDNNLESKKNVVRSNLNINYQPKSKLDSFIVSMVSKQMPLVYLEYFDFLLNNSTNKKWPQSPKTIFTSNAHFANDQFKFWCALNKEKGAKLVISQHGGGIGSMKFILFEYLERKLCDNYVTWGWVDSNDAKIVPLPAQKLMKQSKYKHSPKSGLLHVLDDNARYSRAIQSDPISSQNITYIEQQYSFSNQIDHSLISSYAVRRCPNNFGWDHKEKWNSNVVFDSNKHFIKSIFNYKLVVITNNGTTLLQVLSENIPTVIFWDSQYYEIRASSKNDFDNLRKVGILYDSSELAAHHINSIWNDISVWWKSEELQLVRAEFCKKYARTSNNSLYQWKSFFEEVNI